MLLESVKQESKNLAFEYLKEKIEMLKNQTINIKVS